MEQITVSNIRDSIIIKNNNLNLQVNPIINAIISYTNKKQHYIKCSNITIPVYSKLNSVKYINISGLLIPLCSTKDNNKNIDIES